LAWISGFSLTVEAGTVDWEEIALESAPESRSEAAADREARIRALMREAHGRLTDACWLADQAEFYSLEGEILTLMAALENVIGSPRESGDQRRFPTDDHLA
jgi:hypothetical protein